MTASLATAALAAAFASPAHAQDSSSPATVTRVVDGDAVETRDASGAMATVRLIGIDAPELAPLECGGREAADALAELVEGRPVTLIADPSQEPQDRFGRRLAYVEVDGLDAGEEMLRSGWANVFLFGDRPFARQATYERAAEQAREDSAGAWALCRGAFHKPIETLRLELSAADFVRGYYSLVSRRRFAAAWRRLAVRVRRELGPYRAWRAGFARSLGARVTYASARVRDASAGVRVTLRSRDRDACSGRVVAQRFEGTWTLVRRGGGWLATRIRMRKTGGGRVRVSRGECPARRPRRPGGGGGGGGGGGCDPSYPGVCIPPPPPDLDCGDIRARDFRVRGDDPHGFDGNRDGVGCES